MANVYVRSGAAGAGTGADWANAYLTLAAALTARAAGDDFWVSEDHAETQASVMTLTIPGTAASPNRILCVNHAGSVPPVSADLRTTATVSTTGSNSINFANGYAYLYGITFTAGDTTGTASIKIATTGGGANCAYYFDGCQLKLGGSNSANLIQIGYQTNTNSNAGVLVVWNNTTVNFSNAAHQIAPCDCRFRWQNTASAVAGTTPTTLLRLGSTAFPDVLVFAVDLSALGSGKNLVDVSGTGCGTIRFEDCKLGASVSPTTGTITQQGCHITWLTNCDSGATNYRFYRQNYQATEQQETTIVRSGGATDGTTPVSRKLVSTANSKWYAPYESEWFYIWNDITGGAKTITVYTLTDNVTLTTADCWLEIDYLGSSLTPLGTIDTSTRTADTLAAGSNQPTDTSSWASAPGTPVKQAIAATLTPNMKGLFKVRFCLAKPSTTVYVDPLPVVT